MTMINAGVSSRRIVKAAAPRVNSIVATAATACDLDSAYKDSEAERKALAAKKQRIRRERENSRI